MWAHYLYSSSRNWRDFPGVSVLFASKLAHQLTMLLSSLERRQLICAEIMYLWQ